MAWFRHEDNARNDKRIRALVDDFGPLGELVWARLLEVRCQVDDDIEATLEELVQDLSLRQKWRFPLDRWLQKAARLGLIELRRKRSGRCWVHVVKWEDYQPEWATKKAAAERQRRSREKKSQASHSDKSVTSHSTDVRTDGRKEHVGSARESQGSDVESVSKDELGDRAQQGGSQATEVDTNPNGDGLDHVGEIAGQVLDEAKRRTG